MKYIKLNKIEMMKSDEIVKCELFASVLLRLQLQCLSWQAEIKALTAG